MATNGVVAWIFFYFAIYWAFIRKNDNGENYGLLGAFLIVANGMYAWWVTDEVTAGIALVIGVVYFIKIWLQYKDFQFGGW